MVLANIETLLAVACPRHDFVPHINNTSLKIGQPRISVRGPILLQTRIQPEMMRLLLIPSGIAHRRFLRIGLGLDLDWMLWSVLVPHINKTTHSEMMRYLLWYPLPVSSNWHRTRSMNTNDENGRMPSTESHLRTLMTR